jgi:hypothetical protein
VRRASKVSKCLACRQSGASTVVEARITLPSWPMAADPRQRHKQCQQGGSLFACAAGGGVGLQAATNQCCPGARAAAAVALLAHRTGNPSAAAMPVAARSSVGIVGGARGLFIDLDSLSCMKNADAAGDFASACRSVSVELEPVLVDLLVPLSTLSVSLPCFPRAVFCTLKGLGTFGAVQKPGMLS